MPACGRFDVKYSRTVPGQFVGPDTGQLPSGLPTYLFPDDATTCIFAVRVLLVAKLAVNPFVNRLTKLGGDPVASGSENCTPPLGIVSAWVVLIFESTNSRIAHCEPVIGNAVSA